MSPLAVFRCDASATIGAGHVVRSLTLAEALRARGWTVLFATRAESALAVPALAEAGIAPLAGEDGPEALRTLVPQGCDLLVTDHYGWGAAWEGALRGWAGRILAIDDLADRAHDCDLLLDQSFGREPAAYAGLVPGRCRILTGARHALLRPQFAAARRKRRFGPVARVLVNFGATDPDGWSLRALESLAASGIEAEVDVVLGPASPHLAAVRDACAAMPGPARLRVGVADMAAAMAAADMAVGASGSGACERLCLGLPSVAVITAENQRDQARGMAEAGVAAVVDGRDGDLTAAILGLAGDAEARRRMSEAAMAACDGLGAERLADTLSDRPQGLAAAV